MIAEPEPKPAMPQRPSPPPPTPSVSSILTRDARDRDSGYPASTYRGTPSKISRLTGNSGEETENNYDPSITSRHKYASSIASTRTNRTERGRKRIERGTEAGWENFYIQDDDSEDDDYDRKVLGRAMEMRSAAPKRDKKKALKCTFLDAPFSQRIILNRAIADTRVSQGWALPNSTESRLLCLLVHSCASWPLQLPQLFLYYQEYSILIMRNVSITGVILHSGLVCKKGACGTGA
jgi:hypothetical protein